MGMSPLVEIVEAMIKILEDDYGRPEIRTKIRDRISKNFSVSYLEADIPRMLKDEILEWLVQILEETILKAYKEKEKVEEDGK